MHAVKISRLWTMLCLLVTTAVGISAFVGCETSPIQDAQLTLVPSVVRLKRYQSREFEVSGGLNYAWSIDNPSGEDPWGVLITNLGERVTYLSLRSPSNDAVVRTLTVTSTIGSSGGGSNGQGTVLSASATIFHIPTTGLVAGAVGE